MKKVTEYEIIDHGACHSDYFQGCGISYTDFEDIATGCGDSPAAALDDALESLAQNDWKTETITDKLSEEGDIEEGSDDCHHFVSVRVTSKLPESDTLSRFILPSYWAGYLINGDESGLEEGEEQTIKDFLEKEKLSDWSCADCCESYLAHRNDSGNCLSGDVCEFTFVKIGN